ncbi:MAG TPA: LysR family transcriptional regulator [Bordetella sp.]|nr:LysR family transcriptional regulator [Bordetella sp.]
MRINLRQIEAFRAIMLTHSISGAAKVLNVSQPAVSRLVAYTEQRLGMQLFERIKGRIYPTPEANRLFIEVDSLYQCVTRVNEVAEDLVHQRTAFLRVACSANLSQSLLPRAISAFAQAHPDVQVVLRTMSPSTLLQSLLDRQFEIGVAQMPISHPNLRVHPLFETSLVAAIPRSHPLARRRRLQVSDLQDQKLIGYASDIPFAQTIREMAARAGCILRFSIEVQQVHVAWALAQEQTGIALVDELTAAGLRHADVVVRPLDAESKVDVDAFHLLYEPLGRPAKDFLKTLRSMTPTRMAGGFKS